MPCNRRHVLLLEIQAAHELFHHDAVELVTELDIFVALVDVRIVVDFNNVDATLGLFEVNTVQAVADQIGSLHRDIDNFFGRLVNQPCLALTLFDIAGRIVFHNLPVLFGHEVLTHVNRFAIQHADTPVERRVQIFLRQNQIGVFEATRDNFLQFFFIRGFEHAQRKRTVRDFQDHGILQGLFERFEIALMQDHRLGHRHFICAEQLGQINLVGTFHNRVRIVDHHHAFALSLLGEAVGVVVDLGGLADKQRIVFRQPRKILAFDQLDVKPELLPGLDKFLQRIRTRWRQLFIGVVQNCHVVTRHTLGAISAPRFAQVMIQRLDERRLLLQTNGAQMKRLDRGDVPLALITKLDLEQRATKRIENLPCQVLKFFVGAAPEENLQLKTILFRRRHAAFLQAFMQQRIEVFEVQAVNCFAGKISDGMHRRYRLMPPRFA